MVKKISVALLVSAILITGFFSFKKLNFYEKSIMVFRLKSSGFPTELRGGRDGSQSGEHLRINQRFSENDTLRSRRGEQGFVTHGNNSQEGFRGQGQERRGSHGNGKLLNLNNVIFYLAIFAFFTAISIYAEKACRLAYRKLSKEAQSPDRY
jgi:hypothetical protein